MIIMQSGIANITYEGGDDIECKRTNLGTKVARKTKEAS